MSRTSPGTSSETRRSSGLTPVEQVRRYHRETKHQFMRYARSLGFLDWANQPDPFRRYVGAPLHLLPLVDAPADGPAYDDLFSPARVCPQPLTWDSLSRFLEYALSVTAWKAAGDTRWALRANPSSGNLHPTEGYVLVRAMPGLPDGALDGGAALFHYAPREHGVERRAALSGAAAARLFAGFPEGSFFFGLSSIHWREAWKYGERAFRYCQHDVGHAVGSARLAAAALGWRMVLLSGLSTAQVAMVLGTDRGEDYHGAEHEAADCLAVVFPAGAEVQSSRVGATEIPQTLAVEGLQAMTGAQWCGRANCLSREKPVHWDIIDEVAEATEKPATHEPAVSSRASAEVAAPESLRPVRAHQIIHQRRSAVSFDGCTGLPVDQFYRLFARLVPARETSSVPWDVGFSVPRVHLLVFVHMIEGLDPGLYCLVRRLDAVPLLQQAFRSSFSWTRPPGCPTTLPFYRLGEGDARRVAAQLSCHQDIAGASAFSLGMLAEFDGPLGTDGASAYPRLFWECGLIGQMLYLEAEACGLRGTGIGCYFDDPVHDLIGLTGEAVQSLYHFTVGGPVDDQRLTTLPPYDQTRRAHAHKRSD